MNPLVRKNTEKRAPPPPHRRPLPPPPFVVPPPELAAGSLRGRQGRRRRGSPSPPLRLAGAAAAGAEGGRRRASSGGFDAWVAAGEGAAGNGSSQHGRREREETGRGWGGCACAGRPLGGAAQLGCGCVAAYLHEGVVVVSSHSGQLQGCVGNAVAAWLMAVCFDNCRRCHGGLASSNQAGAAVAPWWRGWWLLATSRAVGCLSLAGGVGRDRRARVDDPIRPSGVCLL